ncbi:hypothetical protein HG263_00265 [Pseudoalteromonas sp. JBTF-M23]|uniref:Lipoprotein n=1 Tax=Pseudoalteromonas caenipelagi TaxID=2726988 RepID=A0A849V8M5_9GAMM|nr:hypothetical protein [Pseudoalteromonas caenipelagi]NOU48983.1 hypothetical protein [Pseudoalteromonas caenipelagi]
MSKHWFYALVAASLLSACSDPSDIIHESSEKSESSLQDVNCIAQKPCISHNDIHLWYAKAHIVGEREFKVFAKIPQGYELKSAMLSGETMNMGYIPVFFAPQQNNVYSATTMVGLCTTEVMQWRLTLTMLNAQGDTLTNTFPLYVIR